MKPTKQAQTEYARAKIRKSVWPYPSIFDWAAIAQFCYVGAQGDKWSFLIR